MKSLLILCPYPLEKAPSQRFRFEQYINILKENGFEITLLPFYYQPYWLSHYLREGRIQKWISFSLSLLRLLGNVLSFMQYHTIFIHREISPIGPPIIEWMLVKIFRRKIIYDFDDAIWLTDKVNELWIVKSIRWRSKVASICRLSYKISAGNEHLANFAKQFNNNVHINPTTIDTNAVHNRANYSITKNKNDYITIGWTGSSSTLKYLEGLESTLRVIEKKHPLVRFLIIADKRPRFSLNNLEFKNWSIKTEIEDLLKIDIGIMPLSNDEWTKGKCGFKALQYMSLEIPALVTPVGVNAKIVDHGVNGFLCITQADWINGLDILISNKDLRKQMGHNGRKKIIEHYSVECNSANFLSLFE